MKKLKLLLLLSTTLLALNLHAAEALPPDPKVDPKATLDNKCGFVPDSKATSSTGKAVDPLDAYIDCSTQMDYKKVFEGLAQTQKDFLVERCMMFTIQNEMGSGGEAAMSTADIIAYEKLVKAMCTCKLEGKVFDRPSTMSGSCTDKKEDTDLFMYTMNMCTLHLVKSDSNVCSGKPMNPQLISQTPDVGSWEESCKNDLRYQCYQFLTIPSVFQEPMNPELGKCNFADQTRIISQQCRSYCYQHNVCPIGQEDPTAHGNAGAGNSQVDPKYKDRKISNVYLLRKLGMSSCVKGTSFGIESNGPTVHVDPKTGEKTEAVHALYADQSCYAEIGVQYKDPECGYRPTCEATPAPQAGANIPRTGSDEVTIVCDGSQAKNVPNDPNAVFCPVQVMKNDGTKSADGKESILPDDAKNVTSVTNIELVKNLGVAKCNPGGNGSPKDYIAKDMRMTNQGVGIVVRNGCYAQFKVKANWERKDCTMAGETASADTCCQSLVYDPAKKTCNAPIFNVNDLDDANNLNAKEYFKNDNERNSQNPYCFMNITKADEDIASKYMYEFGAYEQLFEILDMKADAYFKTLMKQNDLAKFDSKYVVEAPDSNYKLIKKIHEAFWGLKSKLVQKRIDFVNARSKEEAAVKEFNALSPRENAKAGTGTSENTGATNPNVGPLTADELAKLKLNKYYGRNVQEVNMYDAPVAQNLITLAYYAEVVRAFDEFQVAMIDVQQTGLNLAWLCAHKEACSSRNWLIKNKDANDPIISDYFLDPVFPLEIGPVGRPLPTIGGVSRWMINTDDYVNFEKNVSTFESFQKFMHYQQFEIKDIAQPNPKEKLVLQLFRRFATELPLRDNSLLKGSAIEDYLEKEVDTNNKSGLPTYCKAQEDGFMVRTPLGKALEPMRIQQVAGAIKKYFAEALKSQDSHLHNEGGSYKCFTRGNYGTGDSTTKAIGGTDNGTGISGNGNAGTGSTSGGSGTGTNVVSTSNDKILSDIQTLLGDISTQNSFGNALYEFGSAGSKNGGTAGGSAGATSGSLIKAVSGTNGGSKISQNQKNSGGRSSYEQYKAELLRKQAEAMAKRAAKGDSLLLRYNKTANKAFDKALANRAMAAVGKNVFGNGAGAGIGAGKGGAGGSGSGSNSGDNYGNRSGSGDGSGNGYGNGYGSGYGSDSSGGYSYGSGGSGSGKGGSGKGTGAYGSAGYGSGGSGSTSGGDLAKGSGNDDVLTNAIKSRDAGNGEKYKPTDDDSLFDVITKAYIRNYDKVDGKRKKDK